MKIGSPSAMSASPPTNPPEEEDDEQLCATRWRRETAAFEAWFASFRLPGADPLPLWVAEKMNTAWDAALAWNRAEQDAREQDDSEL